MRLFGNALKLSPLVLAIIPGLLAHAASQAAPLPVVPLRAAVLHTAPRTTSASSPTSVSPLNSFSSPFFPSGSAIALQNKTLQYIAKQIAQPIALPTQTVMESARRDPYAWLETGRPKGTDDKAANWRYVGESLQMAQLLMNRKTSPQNETARKSGMLIASETANFLGAWISDEKSLLADVFSGFLLPNLALAHIEMTESPSRVRLLEAAASIYAHAEQREKQIRVLEWLLRLPVLSAREQLVLPDSPAPRLIHDPKTTEDPTRTYINTNTLMWARGTLASVLMQPVKNTTASGVAVKNNSAKSSPAKNSAAPSKPVTNPPIKTDLVKTDPARVKEFEKAMQAVYAYSGASDLTTQITNPNGSKTVYGYEGANSLKRLLSVNNSTSANANLQKFNYGYTDVTHKDARSFMERQSGTNGLQRVNFGYDNTDQLLSETATETTAIANVPFVRNDYAYDRMGNRSNVTSRNISNTTSTQQVHGVNNQNQLLTVTSTPYTGSTPGTATTTNYTYDAGGNLSTQATSGNNGATYVYDEADRLTSWTQTSSTGTNVHQTLFTYDGLSRKRTQTESTWSGSVWYLDSQKSYIYDGMDVVQEREDFYGAFGGSLLSCQTACKTDSPEYSVKGTTSA